MALRLLGLFLFLSAPVFGQYIDRWDAQSDYRHEISGGFLWHPRGLGMHVNYGQKAKSGWHNIQLDLFSMRHEKERRIRSSSFNTPGSFFFGKLNKTAFMHLGYGRSWDLSYRAYQNTVVTRFHISAGPSIAFLKPVYLEIYYPTPDNQAGYLLSEKYNPDKHTDPSIIFGNSSFYRGLGEITTRTGAYFKSNIQLDWSDYKDQVQSVEMGLVLDVFKEDIPIMAMTKNNNVFTTLYICLNIGNRW